MTNTELKPCPFCGGKAKLTDSYERGDTCRSWTAVIEHGCTENTNKFKGARVTYKAGGRDEAEAINNVIESWNRRADDTIIDLQPTVETEPITRCKDCKNYKLFTEYYVGKAYCEEYGGFITENDYCSRGTKMDGKENEK